MKRKLATSPATETVVEAEVIDESPPQTRREFLVTHPPPGEPGGFIDTDELLRRLPVSRGTIRNWCRSGKIPYIKTPGRRVLFCWENVANALRRMERGGGQ
jgi:excisionase family DNA binding protein